MIVFRYDKTLEGLLTAVFDAYARREFPEALIATDEPQPMFTTSLHEVVSDQQKATRVWSGLGKKLSKRSVNMFLHVWLSEKKDSDLLMMRYMRKVFDSPFRISMNFADPDVLEMKQLALKVSRDGHHLRQFIRFQKGGDGTYFAPLEPEFNSLPLAINYLKDRFADQKWLVYDLKRGYGYYYDLEKVVEVSMDSVPVGEDGKLRSELMDADEILFQKMWRDYFKALTIKERINPKLQRQHMPKRFWKYLVEMHKD